MSENLKEAARRAAMRSRAPEDHRNPSEAEVLRAERTFRMISRTHQDMVWMLQVENLSYAEIGERLGIDVAEVERRTAATILAWCRAYERMERPWWRFW